MAGAAGLFEPGPGRPPLALLAAIVVPPALFLVAYRISAAFRRFVLSLDLRLLTAVQAWRVLGGMFLVLYAFNLRPALFAFPAGLGSTVRRAGARTSRLPGTPGPSGFSRSTTRAATTDGSTSASSAWGPPDRDRAARTVHYCGARGRSRGSARAAPRTRLPGEPADAGTGYWTNLEFMSWLVPLLARGLRPAGDGGPVEPSRSSSRWSRLPDPPPAERGWSALSRVHSSQGHPTGQIRRASRTWYSCCSCQARSESEERARKLRQAAS
jgi:hypothetical protein